MDILLKALVLLVVVGFVVWLIKSAPFISATIKSFIRWVAIAVGGFVLIALLLRLFGISSPLPTLR